MGGTIWRTQMHSYADLVAAAVNLSLEELNKVNAEICNRLQTSGATRLVKATQVIQMQKAIIAVGVFSIFEAIIQDRLKCQDGFAEVRKQLKCRANNALKTRFSHYARAINVLKHGRGSSYDSLLSEKYTLPFRIKGIDENFFFEGDVSEVATLVEVDDRFVRECVDVIGEVSRLLDLAGC